MTKGFLKFLMILLFLGAGHPARAQEGWGEYESDHFLVYSNARPDHAEAIVRDLEEFRAYLIRLTNVDEGFIAALKEIGTDPKFLVFGLKNNAYFKSITGIEDVSVSFLHPRGQVTFADFSYNPDPFEGKRGKVGRQMVFYEYARYFLNQYSNFNYPIWYERGLAMYLSTFKVKDGRAQVGLPPLRTVRLLGGAFSHHLTPIEYLLGSTREFVKEIVGLGNEVVLTLAEQGAFFRFENNQFTYDHNHTGIFNPEVQIRVFKHQVWGIVHYLQSDPDRRANLVEYLNRLAAGEEFEAAFEDVFDQSLKDFFEEVYEYTENKVFPSLEVEFEGMEIPGKVDQKPLDAAGGTFIEAWAKSTLLVQEKRLFAIKNQLKAVGGKNADLADTIIGEMDYFTGNQKAALEQADAVLTRSPDYGRVNGLKGAILVDQGEFIKAQPFLFKAIRADANDLIALAALGKGYLNSNSQNLDEGIGALARLVVLNPTDDLARLKLAMLDSKAGNFAQAETDLLALAGWGADEFIRAAAELCLEAVQARQACTNDLSLTASSGN